MITQSKLKWAGLRGNRQIENEKQRALRIVKSLLFKLVRFTLIAGISYVILGPLIGIVASSFFSNADKYSPIVYLIPQAPTLERYRLALLRMDYWNVMLNMLFYVGVITVIQVLVCSLVGYGFARFTFPFKNLVFACVVIMIVIPSHSVMLPLYMAFQNFNPLGLVGLFNGGRGINLLTTPFPMVIMTLFACGLRSGLFIYIFTQFFRGLPKEIEEAAEIDGAGTAYTYLRIMMPNAMPAVITVAIFSLVWQYNDTFFAKLFLINPEIVLSKKIATLQASIGNLDRVLDPAISMLYVYAGIVLMIIPIIALYVLLQKRFIEGVERSGIVG